MGTLVPANAVALYGAGIGFLQRSCKAEGGYGAKVLPSGGAQEAGWENPGAETTRRRIKKTLSNGLRSHSGWRGFTAAARRAAILG